MEDFDTGDVDAGAIDKQLLEELRAFMQQKLQADARGRFGKPPLPAEGELPLEDGGEGGELEAPMGALGDAGGEAIPGVEGEAEAGGAPPGMDLEKMKAALAGMKRG